MASFGTILTDVLEDIPAIESAVAGCEAAIAALPTSGAKISDYTKLAAALLTAIGPLGDAIEAQAKTSTVLPTTTTAPKA